MKIVTWNVNGLRAALNKGVADWWNEQSLDVLCLQEIKAMPEQLSDEQRTQFGQAEEIWNPAQRKGYSGVATFLWTEAAQNSTGIGIEKFDVSREQIGKFVRGNLWYSLRMKSESTFVSLDSRDDNPVLVEISKDGKLLDKYSYHKKVRVSVAVRTLPSEFEFRRGEARELEAAIKAEFNAEDIDYTITYFKRRILLTIAFTIINVDLVEKYGC